MRSAIKQASKVLAIFAIAGVAHATEPVVSSFTGAAGDGNSIQINGANFGAKTSGNAKPQLFADFEQGLAAPNSVFGIATSFQTEGSAVTTASKHAGSYSLGSVEGWQSLVTGARIRYLLPTSSMGMKVYVSFWRRVTYTWDISQNWKWFRFWSPNDGDNYPNWYIGTPPNTGIMKYSEDCTPTPNNRQYGGWRVPGNTWRHEEFLLQVPSSNQAADGIYKLLIDSTTTQEFDTWSFCGGSRSGIPNDLSLQDDPSNFVPPPGVETFKDDVVIDYGWSRVYLGNASTYAASTVREYQPATAWAPGAITITQRFASLSAGGSKWLYVCNDADECNATGLLLEGDGSPDPCTGITCGSGQTCQNGSCFDSCSGITCAPGNHCSLGSCVPDVVDGGTSNGTLCPCYLP